MRDWQAYVRAHLDLRDLAPERQARIIRELASQLDECAREARASGLGDADADARARALVPDWARLGDEVRRADRVHRTARVDRLANRLEQRAVSSQARALASSARVISRSSPANPRAPRDPRAPRVVGGFLMLAQALRDGRYAVRQLIRTPGFTAVAVLTLALGIGATTAIFSVVNGVLLRPLPFHDPDALVRVHERVPQYGRFSVAPANFLDWRAQNGVFERISAYTNASATISTGDAPERIQGAVVSWDLFDLLGVAPALGTGFSAAQDVPGANDVIVISHGLWQSRFGGDPGIVGRSIVFSGAPVTIVGVMPADFYFPTRTAEYWRPIAINPANPTRGGHFLGVVARMKPGVTVERAGAEMKAIAERLAAQYPSDSAGESAEVVALHEQIVGAIRPALLTLLAAVGVVVLIACANVANLLLVRASVREKEIAIRAALGAGRRRLVVQMLVESLVLAVTGGALGVLLAYLAIAPIQTLGAGSIPRVADVAIEPRVLVFALAASLLTGLLFGLAPAWQASRAGVGGVLKEGGRSSATSGGRWVRSGLLVAEVALSIVLLVGATLLLRSFGKLTHVDPGFDPDHVLAFQVSLPQTSYREDDNQLVFWDALLAKLAAVPGVRSTGLVQTLPMRGNYVLTFEVPGRPPAPPGQEPSANHRVVSPDYFKTLSIPLRRGRLFDGRDSQHGKMVAVIDEAFAKKHFPDEDPIGRGLDIGNGTDGAYEIVGIVGDVHHGGLDADIAPTMYVPLTQDVFSTMWVLIRSDGDPSALGGSVRQTLREIDRALPAYSMSPLATIVADSFAQRRFSMLLLALFAAIAVFLAGVGLYGVVSYTVSQRTREVGLRMAIGAQPGDILRMVIGGGMKLALVGVAIGLAAAVALARLVETLLFQVAPFDPVSYLATAIGLLAIAAIACYVPARRAMRVDPIIALHTE